MNQVQEINQIRKQIRDLLIENEKGQRMAGKIAMSFNQPARFSIEESNKKAEQLVMIGEEQLSNIKKMVELKKQLDDLYINTPSIILRGR